MLVAACLAGPAAAEEFRAEALIIPMDTTYQDTGMLQAFGLVQKLLTARIPVHQAVRSGKAQGAADFTASAVDLQTEAVVTDHGYRGGPFLVSVEDSPAALSVVDSWHAAGHTAAVHVATAPFTAEVGRTLVAPPRIAVLAAGNELIAFGDLNAAGIGDSLDQAWPTTADTSRVYEGYPDVLSLSEVAGPASGGTPDGALMSPGGWPKYCHLVAMHYSLPEDEEATREIRLWLESGAEQHLFAQCTSVEVLENSFHGGFLSTAGLVDDGGTPNPLRFWAPDDPVAQFDGSLAGDTGSFNSIGLETASALRSSTSVMIEEDQGQTHVNAEQMLYLRGPLDGDSNLGQVTYLAGHDYSTSVPVSSNSMTNGVRLLLDSLFTERCTIVLFMDGFEDGTVCEWADAVGAVSVCVPG